MSLWPESVYVHRGNHEERFRAAFRGDFEPFSGSDHLFSYKFATMFIDFR